MTTRTISTVNQNIRRCAELVCAGDEGQAFAARIFAAELHAIYADIKPRFECEWESENSPTRGLTEADALRPGTDTPIEIMLAWSQLQDDCEQAGKETAEHRSRRDAIRNAVRSWLSGQSYTLPAVPMPKAARKPAKARLACCPACGHKLEAVTAA
jgi:hypothetical protein